MEFYKQILDYLIKEEKLVDNPSTEMEIAEYFGCSRASVRDALNKLESDRLIIRKKKKGLYLRIPSPQELTESYDLRAVLECYALQLMVSNRDVKNREVLGRLAQDYENAATENNIKKCLTINTQFHMKNYRNTILLVLELQILNTLEMLRKKMKMCIYMI